MYSEIKAACCRHTYNTRTEDFESSIRYDYMAKTSKNTLNLDYKSSEYYWLPYKSTGQRIYVTLICYSNTAVTYKLISAHEFLFNIHD